MTIKLPYSLEPLRALPNWVVWRYKTVKGKLTKVPFQVDGQNASSTEPKTWTTFEKAVAAAPKFDGIGLCLLNSGLAAFDLDHCIDPKTGNLEPWANELVESTGSYTEITPSGIGLRILGYGDGEKVHRKLKVPNANGMSCEIYRKAERYITVSGNVLKDAPLKNIDQQIDEAVTELDVKKTKKKERTASDGRKRELPQALRLMLSLQGDTPAGFPSRSELLWAFVNNALHNGIDEGRIIEACLDNLYKGNSIYEHAHHNGGEDYIRKQIENALNAADLPSGEKALIRIKGGQLDLTWRATEQALIRSKQPVFVRGGRLVQPLWRWEKSNDKSNSMMLACSLVPVTVPMLRDIVGHHACNFQKYDANIRQWKNVDPPHDVIHTLLEVKHWGLKSVKAITNTPTMRPDGSLLTEPGYDEKTELWYKPSYNIVLPDIDEEPTKEQALEALAVYEELLSEFPFPDAMDRSVALAAIMTCVLRGAFEVAPIFLITAPEAGSGQSYLVLVISTITTGGRAHSVTSTPNEEELEKRLTLQALLGRPIINLNNVNFDIKSALLCAMATEGLLSARKMGKNDEELILDCRASTAIINGNNIRIVGDLVRRTLTCRINANLDEPEKRDFKNDPVAMIKADRGKYIAPAMLIRRAYVAAGEPKPAGATNIAGFEDWSRFIRFPLMWLGVKDPVASMEGARAADPERAALAERLKELWAVFQDREFTAADVLNACEEKQANIFGGFPELKNRVLNEAFSREATSGRINAKSIGNQLVKDLDRISGGLVVRLAKKDPKIANSYRMEGPKEEPM
jgi:putative DNA primase/helicase